METKIGIQESHGVITVDQWDERFGVVDSHTRMVFDTTDRLIREKLISLGWTPPATQPTGRKDSAG